VNFIVHSLQQVNDGLAHGRFFFMDIVEDGIALYQSDDTALHTPKPKTAAEAQVAAKEYSEEWMASAVDFRDGFEFSMSKRRWKKAVFFLHQSNREPLSLRYVGSTFYTPHNHNLRFLRKQAEKIDRRLYDVWPRDDRKYRGTFEKLKEAYVKARYSKHYQISEEELRWLGERVEELGRVVHTLCSERIEAFARAAA
jgi:HEPN domain-containing protein